MGTTGQSITLANSIIGVGILAMPFCFQQCGVVLATLILIFMGLTSRLCCYFLLKSALISRRRNFEFLAFHVFGAAGKLAVELGIIGFLMGTCIAYFVVVGDLGPQIVAKMFNINQSDILRTSIMVLVSLVCVLPLGLLRNVDSLSNVSAATIGFYFCLVIKVIAEAASKLPSGEWHHKMEMWQPAGVLQCVPIFSMALFCQTQLFEIFESLPSLSMEKMNVVTKNAINICTYVYFTLGVFGYIAFCSQKISGNILMSLSPTMTSDVIKLGFVMSLAFSFPLIIFPCRASLYSLLYKKVHSSQHDNIINHSIPETTFRCITVGIIFVSLCISLLIPDIELVLGLVGSTIGVLICVVFPTACFVNVTFKNTNERLLAKGVLILGLIIMVLGTYANLQAAEDQLDKYDERYITKERIDKIVEDFFEKRGERVNGLKQMPKNDELQFEAQKPSNMIVKDSEVQPPNPVPPESHSNEVKPNDVDDNGDKSNNDKLLNEVLLPEKVKEDEAVDKISETHPKNLKTKLEEAKLTIEDPVDKTAEKQVKVNEENKVEKIKLEKQEKLIETMKQHGEEQKQLMQEQKEIMSEIIKNNKEAKIEPSADAKVDTPANTKNEPSLAKVEANNADKENQLLETIIQHGKEQKEILKEIIKTKNEYEKNKEENIEAKKIAVESIKQIANMAIKSIGSVTEKPEYDKKAERLEKLTNDAVQQIAKKAVETIEAIKDIKNPEDPKSESKLVDSNKPEKNPEVIIKPKDLPKPAEVNIKPNELPKPAEVNIKPNELPKPAEVNIKPNDLPKPAEVNIKPNELPKPAEVNIKPKDTEKDVYQKEPILPKPVEEINQNVGIKPSPKQIVDYVNNKPAQIVPSKEKVPEKNQERKEKAEEVKGHSHSPDEPESYKEGEDLQNNVMKHNALVPLALKKLQELRERQQKAADDNVVAKNDNIDSNGHRQKREVVDCTNRLALDPLDKNICDSLLSPKLDKQNEVLPKVDLGDSLAMPLDPMHRIGRSLQNYDENERKQ